MSATLAAMDVGSTTVKAVVQRDGAVVWKDYQRHHTRQAEKVAEFLARMQAEAGLQVGDPILFTGSGAGLIAPLVGAKVVQEVVAVAAAVERLHPHVRFVSEIGGEDMKTVFFTPSGPAAGGEGPDGQSLGKQVFMQSACSGGTGTFIEKTARKLGISPEVLAAAPYEGMSLHKVSSKCGIFAEADANTLVKSGVPIEEILASLYEAVVYQNLATLTRGNTPVPQVLLLGGPNLFFRGLQEAWRHHLAKLWAERGVEAPADLPPEEHIVVPADAVYYAALGCAALAAEEPAGSARYVGTERLQWWIDEGQHLQKAQDGASGLVRAPEDLVRFRDRYADPARPAPTSLAAEGRIVGCDFGSTTAKAVVLSADRQLVFETYAPSKGNPIEDAKALFAKLREAGVEQIDALGVTGYGKDLLRDIVGADVAIVETVAHANAALHFFPDADVICDVGGVDVKILLLRHGTVSDFRLNSQCSSGNGAFLQGVAERYGVELKDYADRAFAARAMPSLAMGCGVFLQSDIVNQQRKGWSADEIMASLAAVLPLNVWVYAGQLQNLAAAGRKFVLQGGTHKNLAVVKAQVDFILRKVPNAEIVVHPHPGEAGAIGAALSAADWRTRRQRSGEAPPSKFRGHDTIAALTYRSTTNEATVCKWCAVNCRRTFIDVALPEAKGRDWSKVPLEAGWERVISGNTCPKGLVEDASEMRVVKASMEDRKRAYPNVAEAVRDAGFSRRLASPEPAVRRDPEGPQRLVHAPLLDRVLRRIGL